MFYLRFASKEDVLAQKLLYIVVDLLFTRYGLTVTGKSHSFAHIMAVSRPIQIVPN